MDFQTAVAQAELEDRERPGAMHRVRFAPAPASAADGAASGNGAAEALIETTRPELIPACVALLAHPDDERHAGLVGTDVLTPLFGTRVPVLTHPLVEREKGTGLVMVCTFGDLTDVTWWRELGLPVRSVLGPDGRLSEVPWGAPGWESENLERAREDYAELQGRTINQARKRIVELLEQSGDLIGEPQQVTRAVKFFEKGERPVEIVTSRQWFIRTIEHRDDAAGARPRAAVAPAVHARALRGLGERADGRLVRQPPALLRRAVPGVVPDRRRGQRAVRPADGGAARRSCRSTPRPTCPTATRSPSGGSAAASSATRT